MITAGIDVGSSAVKLALMETPEDGSPPREATTRAKLLAKRVIRLRRRDPTAMAEQEFQDMISEQDLLPEQVSYVATTGEGDRVTIRTGHFYSMTAHARGALHLLPEARGVMDIGGLHARAILMDPMGKVLTYRMTSQCASGSGQFLENISRYLGVTLEEIGELSKQAEDSEKCSSICAVLAETDVINMVSRGIAVPAILRGIHESMAGRYARLLVAAKASGVVLVTGGLAADVGMVAALQDEVDQQKQKAKGATFEVRTHPDSVLAGAIGAALWGAYRFQVLKNRGVDLAASQD